MEPEKDIASLVAVLEEQRNNLRKRCEEYEEEMKKKNDMINKLNLLIQLEKFKASVFLNIITSNTDMKMSDILEDTENGLYVKAFVETGNVPIIMKKKKKKEKTKRPSDAGSDNDDFKIISDSKSSSDDSIEHYAITAKKVPVTKGKTFRTVKNKVDELAEEDPQEQEEKRIKFEEETKELIQTHGFDVPYKETVKIMEDMFKELYTKRGTYSKLLQDILTHRKKLLGKLDIDRYMELVSSHTRKIRSALEHKKYEAKKLEDIVFKSLTPLEQRLIMFPKYYTTAISVDDVEILKTAITVNMNHPTRFVPFSLEKLFEKISNYGLALLSVIDMLKIYISSPFPNICYLQLSDKKDDDPYSFYVLDKIGDDGNRNWRMECRLYEFSIVLAEPLLSYCVKLFRKIYMDVFSDNTYREDFMEKAPIMNLDCAQLFGNILMLSDVKLFCENFQRIVMKNCALKMTKMDKCNFTKDDKMSKKLFVSDTRGEETIKVAVKRIFDGITDEHIAHVLKYFTPA